MASQQVLFSETIAAMKKAIKRTAYESDSDNEIEHYTNRGNKLKKRSLFAHQGQLIPPSGPEVYKEDIEYAGQVRSIINRNPLVLDDDGYELDSDDDAEDPRIQDAITAAADMNPYANVRLEQLLAPLTASTDLPTHPTLSKPFKSETLTGLANQSCEVVRKEHRSLWRTRHLFTRLMGDHTWAPCGMMIGPNDIDLFSDAVFDRKEPETNGSSGQTGAKVNGESHGTPAEPTKNGSTVRNTGTDDVPGTDDAVEGDVSMVDTSTNGTTERVGDSSETKQNGIEVQKKEMNLKEADQAKDTARIPNGEESVDAKESSAAKPTEAQASNTDGGKAPENGDVEMRQDSPSRQPDAAANSSTINGDDAASTASQDDFFIHPIFLPPANAIPDKGGLSEAEAEEMRRLVALYVQKQEEVCRGAHKLHEGLLKAERLRQTVLKWSKFEAHSGANRDLSDGEDWYDKEEWGLSEDLKKGQDEEEEDTATATKKTRNRRN